MEGFFDERGLETESEMKSPGGRFIIIATYLRVFVLMIQFGLPKEFLSPVYI